MADEKKPKKQEEEEVLVDEAEEQIEPRSEAHPGDLTPGMYAEQEVGYYEGDPTSQKARDHAEKFNAAKRKHRFGY